MVSCYQIWPYNNTGLVNTLNLWDTPGMSYISCKKEKDTGLKEGNARFQKP